MTQIIEIHPNDPQPRLLNRVVDVLHRGGVIVYPTDSAYAFGCLMENKQAKDRIRSIREIDKNHNFTLICRDLSEISVYAKVDNIIFRLLKACTPGPYTFVLPATREVPKRFQNPKRKTIGLRVPDNKITQALLHELQTPLVSMSLIMPGDEMPLSDMDDIIEKLTKKVDLIIDGGFCGIEPTTVVDLTTGVPEIVRYGKGAAELIL